MPEPLIEESGEGFRVIFYRRTANTGQNADSNIESDKEIENSSTESSTETIESDKEIGNSSTESSLEIIESDKEIGNSSTESSAEIIESNTKSSTKDDTENYNASIENRLVELLIQYPAITQQEVAERLGYSKAWIRRIMKKMQQEGTLRREGSTKRGIWVVIR